MAAKLEYQVHPIECALFLNILPDNSRVNKSHSTSDSLIKKANNVNFLQLGGIELPASILTVLHTTNYSYSLIVKTQIL